MATEELLRVFRRRWFWGVWGFFLEKKFMSMSVKARGNKTAGRRQNNAEIIERTENAVLLRADRTV